jgi:hypothetical protein
MALYASYYDWKHAVTKRLIARGWARLGDGLFSEVYGKGPYAIKISCGADDWEQYVIWATKAGYAGTFAPRVYCVHRYQYGLIALMERLDCTVGAVRETDNNLYHLVEDRRYCPRSATELYVRYPGLEAFMTDVAAAGYENDTHTGNWMLQRAANRIVLTDPSARPSTSSARRWRAVGNAIVTRDGAKL